MSDVCNCCEEVEVPAGSRRELEALGWRRQRAEARMGSWHPDRQCWQSGWLCPSCLAPETNCQPSKWTGLMRRLDEPN